MDLAWDDERTRKFATNVGLITSNGPHGHNIMAAEWTHYVSYSPALVMVNIDEDSATAENIRETKEFGVSLAAEDQNVVSSVSGRYTGKETDKIAVLRELGVEFYKAKKINVLMVKGAAMNAECRLVKAERLGDHMMLVGEVVEIAANGRMPLFYCMGKYWKAGEGMQKPGKDVLERIEMLAEKNRKK